MRKVGKVCRTPPHSKRERMTVRLTITMVREIAAAAKIVSRERRELVEDSALLREIGMEGVRAILSRAGQQAA